MIIVDITNSGPCTSDFDETYVSGWLSLKEVFVYDWAG